MDVRRIAWATDYPGSGGVTVHCFRRPTYFCHIGQDGLFFLYDLLTVANMIAIMGVG